MRVNRSGQRVVGQFEKLNHQGHEGTQRKPQNKDLLILRVSWWFIVFLACSKLTHHRSETRVVYLQERLKIDCRKALTAKGAKKGREGRKEERTLPVLLSLFEVLHCVVRKGWNGAGFAGLGTFFSIAIAAWAA
jgi:hypothetical protein